MCLHPVKNSCFYHPPGVQEYSRSTKTAGRHSGVIAGREGGHTPETRLDTSDMPPHVKTRVRTRRDALVALLPP